MASSFSDTHRCEWSREVYPVIFKFRLSSRTHVPHPSVTALFNMGPNCQDKSSRGDVLQMSDQTNPMSGTRRWRQCQKQASPTCDWIPSRPHKSRAYILDTRRASSGQSTKHDLLWGYDLRCLRASGRSKNPFTFSPIGAFLPQMHFQTAQATRMLSALQQLLHGSQQKCKRSRGAGVTMYQYVRWMPKPQSEQGCAGYKASEGSSQPFKHRY